MTAIPNDATKIAVGDTVRVNNIPSPKMLVTRVDAGIVDCIWFNRRWEYQGRRFHATELFKCPPRERVTEIIDHAEIVPVE